MALAYAPPGVQVAELYSPSVSPLLSVSASVCLIGLARGYEVGVAQVNFDTAGTAVDIPAPVGTVFEKVDTDTTFEKVLNLIDPSLGTNGEYVEGTDFTATLSTDKKTVTVVAIDTDTGTTGVQTDFSGTVQLTYRFVADNYYDPIRLDSQAAVEARFGPGFDQNGILTPLSAAAAFAFENGAGNVVIQPLVTSAGAQPVDAGDELDWESTLLKLRDIEDVNVIVPVVGASDTNVDDAAALRIFFEVQDHARFMATSEGINVIPILGEDSSGVASDASLATLRTHADQLATRYNGDLAESTVLLSPSRYTRILPSNNNRTILVGGQYVAAAIAGMLAARPTSVPLTRKQLSGFTSVAFPNYDKQAKNTDAQHGLLVVEQKGSVIQVRHSVTLNNTDTAKRELSVVRAKHRMIASIRATLDEQVIGTVPADGNAPLVVQSAIIGVLETLRSRRELVDYSGVQARVLTNDPTTVEARFSYRPAFPLNYVNVVFSLDLSVGEITTSA